jgi:putative phosphoribosyl transferase
MRDVIEFKNRNDAGVQLAFKLNNYKDKEELLVLALPRGGIIVGYEIASYLNCPIDVIIVRKLGFPGNPELAIGAISENGSIILDKDIISSFGISEEYIQEEIYRHKSLIEGRVNLYRKGNTLPDFKGKIVILVDDGVATGATMKVAISTIRSEEIKRLVVAIPVASPEIAKELFVLADEFICLEAPYGFISVGSYYQNFDQVSDDDVIDILHRIKSQFDLKSKRQQNIYQ